MNEKHDRKERRYMRQIKSGNRIAYEICTELYSNREKYKEMEIYKVVMSVCELKTKVGNKYISRTDAEYINMLHNQLEGYFNILLGVEKDVARKGEVLGEEIMPALDLNALGLQKSIELLNAIYCLSFKNDENSEVDKKRRYIYWLLKQVNVDKSMELLNETAEKLVGNRIEDIPKSGNHRESEVRKCQNEKDIQNNTESINKRSTAEILEDTYDLYNAIFKAYGWTHSLEELYQYAKECLIEEKADLYFKKQEDSYPQFGNLKRYYYVWLYVNISCYCILQYSVKEVKNNGKIPTTLKSKIKEIVENVKIESVSPIQNVDELLFQLISYYYRKDYFLQDIKIKKFIEANCESKKIQQQEYSILEESKWEMGLSDSELLVLFRNDDEKGKKKIKNRYKHNSLEYKEIILEEDSAKDKTFQENYERIRTDIGKYCRITFRNIPSDLVHAKAFYRAIYLDKTLFGRRTARQIFNDIVEGKTVKKSDTYYIGEKINMAICRENDKLEGFYELTKFQEQLYYLVCISLAKLNPDDILKSVEGFFEPLRKIISE